MSKLILASASPRRRELMERMGLAFEVIASGVDENIEAALPPELFVSQLALIKAHDIAKNAGNDAIVIGADTLVFLDENRLGKPEDAAHAKQMLSALSGRTHQVYTGICVFRTSDAKVVCKAAVTNVKFKTLTESTIDRYVSTGEPMDKAGAYGIQEKGGELVEAIEGDFDNVVGLPTALLKELLQNEFGFAT